MILLTYLNYSQPDLLIDKDLVAPFRIVIPGLCKSMGGAQTISLLSALPYLLFNTA